MIDVLVAVGACASRSEQCFASAAARSPERILRFVVQDTRPLAATVYWAENHPFHHMTERIRLDRRGLRVLTGYPLDEQRRPIRDVGAFEPVDAAKYGGDYFYLAVSPEGQVTVARSAVCSYPLYLAQGANGAALSSRATLAAMAASGSSRPDLSPDFARWSCSYGCAGSRACLFANTVSIPSSQDVSGGPDGFRTGAPDLHFLTNTEMAEAYRRDRDAYWDRVYETLRESMAVLDYSGEEIEISLSGGKDSRLILGLLTASGRRDRIRRVFTNGPPESPEVRAATLAADALGLPHETVTPGPSQGARTFRMNDRLLPHIHFTECEMGPGDLTWGGAPTRRISLHGQESGLREVSGGRPVETLDEVIEFFRIHLAHGDKCGVFRDGIGEFTLAETEDFLARAHGAGIAPSDLPTLHRVMFRAGRWVARTWRFYNDLHFAPYLFLQADMIQATFNAGHKARMDEEFHIEMLRRVSPDLIEIPFAGQTWQPEIAARIGIEPPEPLRWPEGTRTSGTKPTFAALSARWSETTAWLSASRGPILSEMVDPDKLAQLDLTDAHGSVFQAAWDLVQIALAEAVPDFGAISDGVSATDLGAPNFDLPLSQ